MLVPQSLIQNEMRPNLLSKLKSNIALTLNALNFNCYYHVLSNSSLVVEITKNFDLPLSTRHIRSWLLYF